MANSIMILKFIVSKIEISYYFHNKRITIKGKIATTIRDRIVVIRIRTAIGYTFILFNKEELN